MTKVTMQVLTGATPELLAKKINDANYLMGKWQVLYVPSRRRNQWIFVFESFSRKTTLGLFK